MGDLVRSIPLAPCEQINVATVHWYSQQSGYRQSSVQESDYADTTLTRNRTVSEAVRLSSQKHVSGIQGGGGLSLSIGPLSIGGGVAGSSTDSLTTAAAHSTQSLHDNIHQASAVIRNTRATSVAEVSESEASKVTTRTLRNNNHCHTVTYQYFEVLQRYLVSTEVVGVSPVVYVPFQVINWDIDKVSMYAYTIRRALLDPTLFSVIDLVISGSQEILSSSSMASLQSASGLVQGIAATAGANMIFGANNAVSAASQASGKLEEVIREVEQNSSSVVDRLL